MEAGRRACCGFSEVTRGGKEVCFGFAHPAAWRAADRGGGSRQAAGACSPSWVKGKVTISQWPFLHRSTDFPSSLAPQKVRRAVRGVQVHGCVRTAVLVPRLQDSVYSKQNESSKAESIVPLPLSCQEEDKEGEQAGKQKKTWKSNVCAATQHSGHFPPPKCEMDSKLDAESSVLAWALPTSSLLPHPHTKRAQL